MNVLITNSTLAGRTGAELYVRDIAHGLRGRGHTPYLFCSFTGALSEELQREGFVVVDDLDALPGKPDLIHGQHHEQTMAALAYFPATPAVYFCHGTQPWVETPPRHPRIRRYVAVGATVAEHMIRCAGIPECDIDLVPNFVDTGRFAARPPLPPRPRRALVFSNYVGESGLMDAIRAACGRMDVSVDLIGSRAGRSVHNPEAVLGSYDVVFALGRAALEAMAVGAAVIVCHTEGLGEMVTPSSFERLQHRNFGRSLLSRPATADLIAGELQRYDAAVAAKVRDRVRAEATLAVAMDRILGIYARVASDFPGPLPVAAERTALHRYHQWHARAVRLGLQEPLSEATQRLAEAHARSQDEARRGLALADRVRAVESSLAWRLAQAADRVPGVPNLHRLLRRVAPWLWKPRE